MDSLNQKIKQLEVGITRLSRKITPHKIAFIPPSIIHSYIDKIPETGKVLSCALFEGRITKACLNISTLTTKEEIVFTVFLGNDTTGQKQIFKTKKQVNIISLDMPCFDGDMLTITCDNVDGIEDILVSIMMELSISANQIKHLAIDEG